MVLAYSEQGLLASVFSGLNADGAQLFYMLTDPADDPLFPRERREAWMMAGLRAAAESVGFQHLNEVYAFWRQFVDCEDYDDLLYA